LADELAAIYVQRPSQSNAKQDHNCSDVNDQHCNIWKRFPNNASPQAKRGCNETQEKRAD